MCDTPFYDEFRLGRVYTAMLEASKQYEDELENWR